MDFSYKGQSYRTSIDGHTIRDDFYLLQLPDKRYLMISSWKGSDNPVPSRMKELKASEVGHTDLVAKAKSI